MNISGFLTVTELVKGTGELLTVSTSEFDLGGLHYTRNVIYAWLSQEPLYQDDYKYVHI